MLPSGIIRQNGCHWVEATWLDVAIIGCLDKFESHPFARRGRPLEIKLWYQSIGFSHYNLSPNAPDHRPPVLSVRLTVHAYHPW
jgi:hypothetical protein